MTRLTSLAALLLTCLLAAHAETEAPVVMTGNGPVIGKSDAGIFAFLGIPYAAPTAGDRRWTAPQQPEGWDEVRPAQAYGPACPQPVSQAVFLEDDSNQSEDCLSLNVWTPDTGAEDLPVMVWMHGGAFYLGAGGAPIYDGSALAREDVVVVTLNYRLGALGFFGHPDLAEEQAGVPRANYGFLDQVAALEWVRDNIEAFGGDPDNVTLFGESAGGVSVLLHLYSPLSEDLFDKAIIQSGGGWRPLSSAADLDSEGAALAESLGADSLAALRNIPLPDLLSAQADSGTQWWPVVESNSVPMQIPAAVLNRKIADVPLMIGANNWEASLARARQIDAETIISTVPEDMRNEARKAYNADTLSDQQFADGLYTDAGFAAPARWVARQASKGNRAYLYRFEQVREGLAGKVPGAAHGVDVVYVFGSVEHLASAAEFGETDKAMSDIMIDCWTGFAKVGKPECGTDWPDYAREADKIMVFGNGEASFEKNMQTERLNFQEALALRLASDSRR
ncbi:MAG: carboxylesterase family protein [Pseudomonadota bacterium]|nr:carboxylesterase family protein [Pseudomonadota bacterium]